MTQAREKCYSGNPRSRPFGRIARHDDQATDGLRRHGGHSHRRFPRVSVSRRAVAGFPARIGGPYDAAHVPRRASRNGGRVAVIRGRRTIAVASELWGASAHLVGDLQSTLARAAAGWTFVHAGVVEIGGRDCCCRHDREPERARSWPRCSAPGPRTGPTNSPCSTARASCIPIRAASRYGRWSDRSSASGPRTSAAARSVAASLPAPCCSRSSGRPPARPAPHLARPRRDAHAPALSRRPRPSRRDGAHASRPRPKRTGLRERPRRSRGNGARITDRFRTLW